MARSRGFPYVRIPPSSRARVVHGVGLAGGGISGQARAVRRGAAVALEGPGAAVGSGGSGLDRPGPVHSPAAGARGRPAGAGGGRPHVDAPGELRGDRPAAEPRCDGGVPRGSIADAARQRAGPDAGVARVRGALGAALAGLGALRGDARARGRLPDRQRMALPGLPGAGVQRGCALRPDRCGARRGRPAGAAHAAREWRERVGPGHGLGVPGRGGSQPRGHPAGRVRPDGQQARRADEDVPGPDRGVRAVPRPQVRPDPAAGLLRDGRGDSRGGVPAGALRDGPRAWAGGAASCHVARGGVRGHCPRAGGGHGGNPSKASGRVDVRAPGRRAACEGMGGRAGNGREEPEASAARRRRGGRGRGATPRPCPWKRRRGRRRPRRSSWRTSRARA